MRFVVITVPPPPIAEAIEAFRRPLNALVGAGEALRYPPHVTLRTGLVCPDDQASTVAADFLAHARLGHAFRASTERWLEELYRVGTVERALVGWAIEPSEALLALHRHLLGFTAWQKGPQAAFQPHLSLVYGDIGRPELRTLQEFLSVRRQPIPAYTWTVDHVALYHELADGWVEWGRTALRSSSAPRTGQSGPSASERSEPPGGSPR